MHFIIKASTQLFITFIDQLKHAAIYLNIYRSRISHFSKPSAEIKSVWLFIAFVAKINEYCNNSGNIWFGEIIGSIFICLAVCLIVFRFYLFFLSHFLFHLFSLVSSWVSLSFEWFVCLFNNKSFSLCDISARWRIKI